MQRVTYTLGPESPIPERELLEVVEAAVNSVSSNIYLVGVGSNVCLSKRGERSLWEGDIRMAAFQNDGDLGASPGAITSDDLQPFIVEAKGDADLLGQTKSAHFLAVEIGKRVFSFLLEPEEAMRTSCSLPDLGMDSVVAIEVRQWWKSVFGFDISVLEMMVMGSLDDLGAHTAKGTQRLFHAVNT